MSGRADYEERKQMKKERYEEFADNARKRSQEQFNKHNSIANRIPFGQPILFDHYSANRHRNDIKKMEKAIEKAVQEDKKAEYYDNKITSIDNNSAISSDDPEAINKLEKKLENLEKKKVEIKSREHAWFELPYINRDIKNVKDRIQQLKELDEINFEPIIFKGGKIIHNKEINRIQMIFDDIPSEEVRILLKNRAFKWSKYERAWQRLFNKSGIRAAKDVLEEIEKL